MTNLNKNKIDFIDFDPRLNNALQSNINEALNIIIDKHQILSPVELSIKFVDDNEIRQFNKEFRNIDKSTDVLSFPIFENVTEINQISNGEGILLGDILLNLNQASKQAKEIGQSLEDEVLYLSIHSILHLLGYDHMIESDKKVMRDLEKEIFKKIINNV